MAISDSYVRARIDAKTKANAENALAAMGLSVSDAIRLLMVRVANDRAMPFAIKAPNKATTEAIGELESGLGNKACSIDELVAQLNAKD